MQPDRRSKQKWANLYLVRHGESTANEVNRFAGMVDAPLTDLGRAQATKAAVNWCGQTIDQVYVSPLTRAQQTAHILMSSFSTNAGAQPALGRDARLSERHFGEFTLRNKTLIQRKVGLRTYEEALYGNHSSLSEGENFQTFYDRVLDFLKNELHPLLISGKRVLVVAHKYVIELLSRLILRLPPDAGYDIRLPNATIMAADALSLYLHKESRRLNLVQDWIVMNHSSVVLGGVLLGLILRIVIGEIQLLPILAFGLISLATVISLIRVPFINIKAAYKERLIPKERLFIRFALLPLAIGILGIFSNDSNSTWIFALALLLAAPSAITALTISRSAGGMVQPSVYMILLSTLVSVVVIFCLLNIYGMAVMSYQALGYLSVSVVGLVMPLLIARWLRYKYPISTAKFAERNAAMAVILLSLFVTVSFLSIDLESFWPYGVYAIFFGLLIRITAFSFARQNSLYVIDDYVSMAYPNIFVVIIIAEMLNIEFLAQMATWFLVPMFALAPLDEILCQRLQRDTKDPQLLSFLRVQI
jgi:broad specificity phosphatase PhoE/predicted permease